MKSVSSQFIFVIKNYENGLTIFFNKKFTYEAPAKLSKFLIFKNESHFIILWLMAILNIYTFIQFTSAVYIIVQIKVTVLSTIKNCLGDYSNTIRRATLKMSPPNQPPSVCRKS